MWMEQSFEDRYSEQRIRYVHDGSCVLDRNFGRRPLNEPLTFGLHEANLPLQPTAASHSFGQPHLRPAEHGMDGSLFEQPYPRPQVVYAAQPPAHSAASHSFGQPYVQAELVESAAPVGSLFDQWHSQPWQHSQQQPCFGHPTAPAAMGMDGSCFEQPYQQAVLVQQHPADSAASHSFGLGQQPPGDKELREQPAGFGQQTVVTATAAGDFCGLQWTAVESLGPELSHLQAAPLAKKRDRGDGDSERRDGGEETTKRAKIDQMPLNVYFRLHWRLALLRTRAPNPSALPMCRICCTSCTR
jgi:hypothetical protein